MTTAPRDPRIPNPVDPSDGPIILLDMDGVCVNFVKGVCTAVMKYDYEAILKTWPKGEYDVCRVLDISPDIVWGIVDRKGHSFWEHLEQYPWFWELYRALCDKYSEERVFFATTPSWRASSFSGKIQWLYARFGREFCNYIFTPHKTLLARPGAVLIDDSGDHTIAFCRAGGTAVLFPQPWNKMPEPEDRVEYVINGVCEMLEGVAARM